MFLYRKTNQNKNSFNFIVTFFLPLRQKKHETYYQVIKVKKAQDHILSNYKLKTLKASTL